LHKVVLIFPITIKKLDKTAYSLQLKN